MPLGLRITNQYTTKTFNQCETPANFEPGFYITTKNGILTVNYHPHLHKSLKETMSATINGKPVIPGKTEVKIGDVIIFKRTWISNDFGKGEKENIMEHIITVEETPPPTQNPES